MYAFCSVFLLCLYMITIYPIHTSQPPTNSTYHATHIYIYSATSEEIAARDTNNNGGTHQADAAAAPLPDLTQEQGFLCNRAEHWFAIRKVHEHFVNLNSTLDRPEASIFCVGFSWSYFEPQSHDAAPTHTPLGFISPINTPTQLSQSQAVGTFYLDAFLAQLRECGFSVFVVRGVRRTERGRGGEICVLCVCFVAVVFYGHESEVCVLGVVLSVVVSGRVVFVIIMLMNQKSARGDRHTHTSTYPIPSKYTRHRHPHPKSSTGRAPRAGLSRAGGLGGRGPLPVGGRGAVVFPEEDRGGREREWWGRWEWEWGWWGARGGEGRVGAVDGGEGVGGRGEAGEGGGGRRR